MAKNPPCALCSDPIESDDDLIKLEYDEYFHKVDNPPEKPVCYMCRKCVAEQSGWVSQREVEDIESRFLEKLADCENRAMLATEALKRITGVE